MSGAREPGSAHERAGSKGLVVGAQKVDDVVKDLVRDNKGGTSGATIHVSKG